MNALKYPNQFKLHPLNMGTFCRFSINNLEIKSIGACLVVLPIRLLVITLLVKESYILRGILISTLMILGIGVILFAQKLSQKKSHLITAIALCISIAGFLYLQQFSTDTSCKKQEISDENDCFCSTDYEQLQEQIRFFFGLLVGACLSLDEATPIHRTIVFVISIVVWSFQSNATTNILISLSFLLEAFLLSHNKLFFIKNSKSTIYQSYNMSSNIVQKISTHNGIVTMNNANNSGSESERDVLYEILKRFGQLNMIVFSKQMKILQFTQHFKDILGIERDEDSEVKQQFEKVQVGDNQNLYDHLKNTIDQWYSSGQISNSFEMLCNRDRIYSLLNCQFQLEKYQLYVIEITYDNQSCLLLLANPQSDIYTFNQYKHKMINSISHDLKTPLNAIILLIDILKLQLRSSAIKQSQATRQSQLCKTPKEVPQSLSPFLFEGSKQKISLQAFPQPSQQLQPICDQKTTVTTFNNTNELDNIPKEDLIPYKQISLQEFIHHIPEQMKEDSSNELSIEKSKSVQSFFNHQTMSPLPSQTKNTQSIALSHHQQSQQAQQQIQQIINQVDNSHTSSILNIKHVQSNHQIFLQGSGNSNTNLNQEINCQSQVTTPKKEIRLQVISASLIPLQDELEEDIEDDEELEGLNNKEKEKKNVVNEEWIKSSSMMAAYNNHKYHEINYFKPNIDHLDPPSNPDSALNLIKAISQINTQKSQYFKSSSISKNGGTNGKMSFGVPSQIKITPTLNLSGGSSPQEKIQIKRLNLKVEDQKPVQRRSFRFNQTMIQLSGNPIGNKLKKQDQQQHLSANYSDIKTLYSYICSIEKNGYLLESRINDLIDYSTLLSKNDLSLSCTSFDLKEILKEMKDLYEFQATKKKCTLIIPITSLILKNDKPRLKQILNNVLGNAIKFTFEGFIRIIVAPSEHSSNQLTITVQDTGIGIPDNIKQNLLNFNAHISQVKDDSRQGVGIGLEICSRLCQIIGPSDQEIQVQSKVNEGSIFSFQVYLNHPLYIEERDPTSACIFQKRKNRKRGIDNQGSSVSLKPEPEHEEDIHIPLFETKQYLIQKNRLINHKCHTLEPQSAESSLQSQQVFIQNMQEEVIENDERDRILIVDDVAFNLLALRNTLKLICPDAEILEAQNGKQAVDTAREYNSKLDLIIMDINMPIMDGFQAMQIINSEIQSGILEYVPIIAHTAFDNNQDKQKCFSLGAKGFLPKPVKKTELEKAIMPYLSSSNS